MTIDSPEIVDFKSLGAGIRQCHTEREQIILGKKSTTPDEDIAFFEKLRAPEIVAVYLQDPDDRYSALNAEFERCIKQERLERRYLFQDTAIPDNFLAAISDGKYVDLQQGIDEVEGGQTLRGPVPLLSKDFKRTVNLTKSITNYHKTMPSVIRCFYADYEGEWHDDDRRETSPDSLHVVRSLDTLGTEIALAGQMSSGGSPTKYVQTGPGLLIFKRRHGTKLFHRSPPSEKDRTIYVIPAEATFDFGG